MRNISQKARLLRFLSTAIFGAVCLTLLLPVAAGATSTQAALIRSDPVANAILQTPPTQVHLWFSDDLNPTLSTVQVVNSSQRRVDNQDAQVDPSDSTELDVSVQANLQPDVYTVVWRTVSAEDGQILNGSFAFTIANADGTAPQLAPGVNPGLGILGYTGANSSGTLGATAIFNLIVITLIELGAIFWVAAQFWTNFVLQNATEKHPEEQDFNSRIEQRFERRFSVPTLILLLLANLGLLYGQALYLTGNWGSAFSLQLFGQEVTGVRFGTYWFMRIIVLLLALIVGISMAFSQKRPRVLQQALPLVNLFLGAMLFVAMTMSGDATSVSSVMLPYAVVLDWLHLIAAALWIGSMIYILLIYLPVLRAAPSGERARSLLVVLSQYSPLAIAGVIIMAISGPLAATFHLTAANQFFTTGYGRALSIKALLICVLLVTGAYQVFWLRPRLKKEYQKYVYTKRRLETALAGKTTVSSVIQTAEASAEAVEVQARASATAETTEVPALASAPGDTSETPETQPVAAGEQTPASLERSRSNKLLTQQAKLREERIGKKLALLTRILRWEPRLGAAILVCVALMSIFSGPLAATNVTTTSQQQNSSSTPAAGPYNGTAKTSDGAYAIALNVSPNRFGANVFTVKIIDNKTGKALNQNGISVTMYTTMLDMDMGTDSIGLSPDGKGGFSATQDLAMSGNWGIEIQVRTPDNQLHKANFKILTPF